MATRHTKNHVDLDAEYAPRVAETRQERDQQANARRKRTRAQTQITRTAPYTSREELSADVQKLAEALGLVRKGGRRGQ